MINLVQLVDILVRLKAGYLYERIPAIYGAEYYIYWSKPDFVFRLYEVGYTDLEKPLAEYNFEDIDVLIHDYYLDINALTELLSQNLLSFCYVNAEHKKEAIDFFGAEVVAAYDDSIDNFKDNLVSLVNNILKPKLTVIEGGE